MSRDQFSLSAYDYALPEDRIAQHPLARRDQAKMLVYREGRIHDQHFYELPGWLPGPSCLCFNNTRVIPARLHFRKPATVQGPGALIEILLLHPVAPSPVMSQAMSAVREATWECMIGNLRKWKVGMVLQQPLAAAGKNFTLRAQRVDSPDRQVHFSWDADVSFAEVVEAAGKVPLPPYLHRESTAEDRQRYQTIYAKLQGGVAAPTAGLHFTDAVLDELKQGGVTFNELTLHVGAGTFQPIQEEQVQNHTMHNEQMVLRPENIEHLLKSARSVIAVGTTSLRTLESLYWYGVLLRERPGAEFRIPQDYPYRPGRSEELSLKDSLEIVLEHLQRQRLDTLIGETEIFIYPGYRFRVVRGLLTNFHLPKSTLILLIAAFIGEDWRSVYQHALAHDYRFLSYGDASLLMPNGY